MGMQLEQEKSRSISRILETVEKIAAGDFSVKVPISEQGDDFDALAAGINMLSEELEAISEDQQKQNEALLFMLEDLDVEKRKADKALQSSKESEERLQLILNSVQAGVLLIDPENHVIMDINPKAEKILDIKKESIVGNVCHEFICPACKGNCPITDLNQNVDNSERTVITLIKPYTHIYTEIYASI